MINKMFLPVLILAALNGSAQTVDEMMRKAHPEGKEMVRAACSEKCDLIITGTTDGNVTVKRAETKYFKISDEVCYWQCCQSRQKSNIKGGIIRVVRNHESIIFYYIRP